MFDNFFFFVAYRINPKTFASRISFYSQATLINNFYPIIYNLFYLPVLCFFLSRTWSINFSSSNLVSSLAILCSIYIPFPCSNTYHADVIINSLLWNLIFRCIFHVPPSLITPFAALKPLLLFAASHVIISYLLLSYVPFQSFTVLIFFSIFTVSMKTIRIALSLSSLHYMILFFMCFCWHKTEKPRTHTHTRSTNITGTP